MKKYERYISIMVSFCLLLGIISIFSGCSSTEDEMQESWDNMIAKMDSYGYCSYRDLNDFKDKYGGEESFEEFVLNSFEKLSTEQIFEIITASSSFASQKMIDYAYDRVEFSKKTFDEKIEFLFYLEKNYCYSGGMDDSELKKFYFIASAQEFDEWANSKKEENLYFEEKTGYYADESYKYTSGGTLTGNEVKKSESVTYYGDFKCVSEYSTKLDSTYHEYSTSSTQYYFRDKAYSSNYSPNGNERFLDGKYLIQHHNYGNCVDVHDMESVEANSVYVAEKITLIVE